MLFFFVSHRAVESPVFVIDAQLHSRVEGNTVELAADSDPIEPWQSGEETEKREIV